MTTFFAYIPAPPSRAIHLGPLQLRAYGLMIALGVVAAVSIARRRWSEAGHDPEDISAIATWAVPAGLIGARLYHVATDYRRFEGRWLHALEIWEGGLGIPGGLLAGVLVGLLVARRRGVSLPAALDAVAPAIPVAQAIGRVGNWFNQELFGRPSTLPWALRVDPADRPPGMADVATYHPTFLYEAIWNLLLAALLVWLGRRLRLRPGRLFACYVLGYGTGRLWVESLRIDEATRLFGVRVNIWVSAVAIVVSGGYLVLDAVRTRRERRAVALAGRPPPGAPPP